MGNLHRDLAMAHAEKFLESPGAGETLAAYLKNMHGSFYDDMGEFVQRHGRAGCFDIYDAYAFAIARTMLFTGELLKCSLRVHACPGKDAAVDANQAKLDRLPVPFSAKVVSGGDDDGRLEWNTPIQAFQVNDGHDALDVPWQVEASYAPLEIGTTEATCSLHHIVRHGCLARWPYGSKSIILFIYKPSSRLLSGLLPLRKCRRWPQDRPSPANLSPHNDLYDQIDNSVQL